MDDADRAAEVAPALIARAERNTGQPIDDGLRARFTGLVGSFEQQASTLDDERRALAHDRFVDVLTKRLVLIAETIATTTGWLGSWDFGIAIKRLRGLLSLLSPARAAVPGHTVLGGGLPGDASGHG